MKKKNKKEHQVNIRLDDERYVKLNDLEEKSGMRKSDIIRNLIDKGAVNVFYGQKDIMARVSRVEDSFNKSTLVMRKDLERLNKNVMRLDQVCSTQDSDVIRPLAMNLALLVERIGEKHSDMREAAERELCEHVNI